MVLTRSMKHITEKSIDDASKKNMKSLQSKQSGILNGGMGLFTTKKLKALEPIGWYEGDVHSERDCVDSSYCASLNGVHVDPRNQLKFMLRYANDAYRNKNLKNNAKMEFMLRSWGGNDSMAIFIFKNRYRTRRRNLI